jgi:hypothetical protein
MLKYMQQALSTVKTYFTRLARKRAEEANRERKNKMLPERFEPTAPTAEITTRSVNMHT